MAEDMGDFVEDNDGKGYGHRPHDKHSRNNAKPSVPQAFIMYAVV